MKLEEFRAKFASLPQTANEAVVSANFVKPLLYTLGYDDLECIPEFRTGNRNQKVDYAARKNTPGNNFIDTHENPELIIEIKSRNSNISHGSQAYRRLVSQLKGYWYAKNCIHSKWGIITNGSCIQLFRKHEKLIIPITKLTELNSENIEHEIANIKEIINANPKAVTISIYNNKGGVGKTTTLLTCLGSWQEMKKGFL